MCFDLRRRFLANAEKLKSLLDLVPLSIEGGHFSETYRSVEMIPQECLQGRYSGPRTVGTCIYYLLQPNTFSELHRVASDEIFHFYLGDPVEMLQLWPDGSAKQVLIGTDIESGVAPQLVVPHGVWQGQGSLPEENLRCWAARSVRDSIMPTTKAVHASSSVRRIRSIGK
jgi:uncharacterized protein